jgi:AcrR family transcriptional regulator
MTSDQPESSQASGSAEQLQQAPQRMRARRLPAGERRATILREASLFFAKEGFSASTRDLADRLGVRQALLYKYYDSKESLLQAIFDNVFADRLVMDWADVLKDRATPLAERLKSFYARYSRDEDGICLRLFLRASLDGWPLPLQLSEVLNAKLIAPLVDELRHVLALPSLSQVPMMEGERELVFGLHASVLFYCMRREIYAAFAPPAAEQVIDLHVRAFLDSADSIIQGLHRTSGGEPLAAPIA